MNDLDFHKKGGELDQKLIEELMTLAVKQVYNAFTHCLNHSCTHLGVAYDHPSRQVVLNELKDRVQKLIEEQFP